ncbi:larval cuticle protein 65Ab1-like [Episyrphus balteatus]|uniref:larval cuticle protein 65Ab1-like n=1 Tax=Episyrphus balteatus TaxID=286459 RepID=UPI0024869DF3|nr:larval cuticle protein 65Ab1-like [Episyrphus balteatus]
MQKLITLCSLFAVVAVVCSVEQVKEPVKILRQESVKNEDGSYTYLLETDDGYFKEESGVVINPGSEDPKVRVSGNYHYVDAATGEVVSVEYTADENGFYPSGSHIAKEITDAALKSKDNPREPQPQYQQFKQPAQLPKRKQF